MEGGVRRTNVGLQVANHPPTRSDVILRTLGVLWVGKYEKLRGKILASTSDASIEFSDLCQLLKRLGFDERVNGSHHIFSHDRFEEIVNLQPLGSQCKPYQVKQVRRLIVRYRLGGTDVD